VHTEGKDLEPSVQGRELPDKYDAAHDRIARHQLGVGCGDFDPAAASHLETQHIDSTEGWVIPALCSRAFVS
jgi:hypothetical protein